MKKILLAFTAVVVVFIVFSCKNSSGGGSTPTLALKAMAEDAKKGDYKVMMKNMCKKDADMMSKAMQYAEAAAKAAGIDINEMMKKQMQKNNKFDFDDVEFKNEKIDGNNASVEILKKGDSVARTINLTKEDGSWKICMGLADKMNAAMEGKGMGKMGDTANMNKAINKMKEAMEKIKPEDMEKMKEMMKNIKPEDIEKMKESLEKMKH